MEVLVAYSHRIGAYPGHSGLPQTSKMESFTKKLLTIVKESSILGVATVLDPPLE